MEELKVGDKVTWIMEEGYGVGVVVNINSKEFETLCIEAVFKGGDSVVYGSPNSFRKVD